MKTEELIALISDLPIEQRVEIVDGILQSFHRIDPEIEQAWAEEAKRRLEEFKKGNAETIPGENVINDIRGRLTK